MNKYLLMAVSFVLVAALAVVGTLAYLQFETPTDVNVMTVGNVKIEQHEYERVVDENGNWVSTGEVDKYGYTPDKLQEYTQAKPLYPAVFADGQIKWDDRNGSTAASGEGSHQQSWAQVGASGSIQLFDDSVKNAIDKFVFVENTGKTDAYVRTVFAFEQGDLTAEKFGEIIATNGDSTRWAWETVATDVVIDGCEYVLVTATYVGASSNPNGILAAGKVSYPSLLQVYMMPTATNEDVEAIDGNGNGTYDILVISQAVQAKGFDDANVALNAAFGEITANSNPWVDGVEFPVFVSTADELTDALAAGGTVILAEDIEGSFAIPAGVEVTLELNGKNITYAGTPVGGNPAIALINNGTLTIKGEGTISGDYAGFYNTGNAVVNGGTFESKDGFGMITDNIYGTEVAVTEINGGTFAGIGIYNPTDVTINNCVINVGRDPDGASDHLSDEMALFVSPTFQYTSGQIATVILNGGSVNGDVYLYSDSFTETTFENNGATITGSILTND